MSSNRPDKPVDAPPDKTPVDPNAPGGPPVKPQGDIDNPGKTPPPPPPPPTNP